MNCSICGKCCTGKKYCLDCFYKLDKSNLNISLAIQRDGKYRDKEGYIWVRSTHPKNIGGFIQEHRLVMEKALGRYLNEGEIIHHKNHSPSDNRLENLELVSREKHRELHRV